MKLYDTSKELTFDDYKPLNYSLKDYSIAELEMLADNLQAAIENGFMYGNDFLCMALDMDLKKVELNIKMKQRKAKKEG